jgi:ligand-binding sensor domain-containing protein
MGGARGLWRIEGDAVRHQELPAPIGGLPIQAMVDDGGGRLRLSVLRQGQWVQDDGVPQGWRHEPEPAGVPDTNPLAMLRDARGRLWLGYGFDRVVLREPGRPPRTWLAADGLDVGSTLCLAAQGERLWVGGERGVALLAGGVVHALRIEGGQALAGVSGIVADAAGDVWLIRPSVSCGCPPRTSSARWPTRRTACPPSAWTSTTASTACRRSCARCRPRSRPTTAGSGSRPTTAW